MIDLKELLKAGVHFGHKTSRWSPKMRPFIWGSKNKVHLIDVSKTALLMERAAKFLTELTKNGKTVLWIGTKKPAQEAIKKAATSLNMPFVIHRWIGGTLTNFRQVKKAITRYLYLQEVIKKTTPSRKKEISSLQKEIYRLERNIGGIIDLDFPPGAIVLVDAKKEASSIREAISTKIPVIAVIDTNTDPSGINFIIPANDDSPRSINCILQYLTECVKEGQKLHQENKIKEENEKAAAIKEAAEARKREIAARVKAPRVSTPAANPAPAAKPLAQKIEAPKTPIKKEEPAKSENIEKAKTSV